MLETGEHVLNVAHMAAHRGFEFIHGALFQLTHPFLTNTQLFAQFLKGDSPTDLVRRTDAATYEAKRQGKNRAVCDACLEG